MDIEMPVMNGYEATRLIREAERTYNLLHRATETLSAKSTQPSPMQTQITTYTAGSGSLQTGVGKVVALIKTEILGVTAHTFEQIADICKASGMDACSKQTSLN